jgi:signal transduction histidine kinase
LEHPEVIDKALTYIDTESERMRLLVEEMLALSRADATSDHDEPFETVDLKQLAELVIRVNEEAITQNIALQLAPDSITVQGVPRKLQQVLVQLINTAAKYSDPATTITIKVFLEDGHPVLQVADEGVGISNEAKDLVFERFYRGDEARSKEIEGMD